jgi:uncharacterized protein with FMN-binding domain
MRRAPIVLSATALGLGATLGFHAHMPTTSPAASAATTSASSSSSSSSAASSSPGSSSSSSSAAKTVTSDAVATQYGPVQLKVTIAGGKITNITALQLPANDPKSAEIGSYAEPLLRQSALSKQSADIDVVSGATYTSDGYKTALQSALDKAGFQASTSSSAGTA